MANLSEEYERQPIVSLEKSLESLTSLVPDIQQMLETIQGYSPASTNHLSSDESGSILLYTLKRKTHHSSFAFFLNQTLRLQNREKLLPWYPYLRLFTHALSKLPSISSHTVYHSSKTNRSNEYSKGDQLLWWEFVPCKSAMEFLEHDSQVVFVIECHHAKDISEYSLNENEILLSPGKQFEIISIFDSPSPMKFIQIKETQQKQSSSANSQTIPNKFSSIDRLESHLAHFPQHSKIELIKKNLTDQDVDVIINHAIIRKECRVLILSDNKITSIGASKLARSLHKNQTLESLSLAYNPIGDEGIESLIQILTRNNCKLNALSLHQTGMTDRSIKPLVEMLKKNKTLTWLHLGRNEISDKGFVLLADVLIHDNETLRVLDLSNNKLITDASGDIIYQLLDQSEKLETLWITNCALSENEQKKLEKFTRLHHRFLVFSCKQIKVDDASRKKT